MSYGRVGGELGVVLLCLELVGYFGFLFFGHAAKFDGVLGHAQGQTLLEATILTAIAVEAIDYA